MAVKLDIKNAQNCIARARCVDEIEAVPELHHLSWHVATTLGPHTALHSGGSVGGQLKRGSLKGTQRPLLSTSLPGTGM